MDKSAKRKGRYWSSRSLLLSAKITSVELRFPIPVSVWYKWWVVVHLAFCYVNYSKEKRTQSTLDRIGIGRVCLTNYKIFTKPAKSLQSRYCCPSIHPPDQKSVVRHIRGVASALRMMAYRTEGGDIVHGWIFRKRVTLVIRDCLVR